MNYISTYVGVNFHAMFTLFRSAPENTLPDQEKSEYYKSPQFFLQSGCLLITFKAKFQACFLLGGYSMPQEA